MTATFSEVLHRLVRDPRWYEGGLEGALRALTEAASQALTTSRVSVWERVEDGDAIRCACLYDFDTGTYESGARLAVEDCPEYFLAIADARIVAVTDALTDRRTRGLGPAYLEPLGIGALLDAPIMIDGQMAGVVCHEARHGPRQWDDAERAFAASIGDLAALAYQSDRRRRAEKALRLREEEMRLALSAARVADWSFDLQTRRVRWSDSVGPLFGRPAGWQPGGMDEYAALIHEGDRQAFVRSIEQSIAGKGDYYVEHRGLVPGGGVRWFQCRGRVAFDEGGSAVAIHGVIADHTARRELEDRLARSDRLESLGRLAGGVAHDFNNLLTAIMGACELLGLEHVSGTTRDRIAIIERAVDRATSLTGQLLAFSSRMPRAPGSVELTGVLVSSVALLERILGEHIELRVHAPNPVWVLADPTHLEQLIVNLSVNARDAMPRGGELSFRIRELSQDGEGCAELEVSDTGNGIPPEVLDRIFEPFFSTKREHGGTGLGLATCHGIVHQYGGQIAVTSEIGRGTTFRISLPTAEPSEEPEPKPQKERTQPNRRHHVLVLEDAADVAGILVEVLRQDGHEVTHFARGDKAVAWLQAGNKPTVIVSDVMLEGLRGTEVALVAREIHPNLPCLLITGYAPEAVPSDLDGVKILTKPFRSEDVLRWLGSLDG